MGFRGGLGAGGRRCRGRFVRGCSASVSTEKRIGTAPTEDTTPQQCQGVDWTQEEEEEEEGGWNTAISCACIWDLTI